MRFLALSCDGPGGVELEAATPLGEGPGSALGSTTELGAHQAPTSGWARTVAWVKTCSFRRC